MAGGLKDTIQKMVGQLELMQNIAIMKNKIRQTVTAYMILWKTKIIPIYYAKDENGMSKQWVNIMKNSIISTGGRYSTARMLTDYVNNLYIHLQFV